MSREIIKYIFDNITIIILVI